MSRLAVATVLLCSLPVVVLSQTPPDSGDVVVNEIMYAPSPSTNEFIELYNRSDSSVNLRELEYADANKNYSPAAPTDTLLSPGAYVVLVRDSSEFESAFPGVNYIEPDGWYALNNGGDTVLLRHASSGTRLDSLPYDPSWGGDDGRSLERIDPAGPSDQSQNFATSDADEGATPAAENSVYNPDTTAPTLQAVQPTRGGDSLVAEFSEPLDGSTVSNQNLHLTRSEAPTVADAGLSDTSTTTIHCRLGSTLTPGEYTLVATNVADPRGNVQSETSASFGFFVPETPDPRDLVINEILYGPSPPSNEFIEVYNRSEKTVDLGMLEYADENREFNRLADPLTALPPDSHVVFVRDPDAFEAAFPHTAYHTPSGWNALNNGGDKVILRHSSSLTVIDAVPYEPSWGGDQGHSLERIDPAAPSDAVSNFASSVSPMGATPGRRNSRFDPDRTPPSPIFAEQVAPTAAEITFSEPLRPASVTPDAFDIESASVTAVRLVSDSIAKISLSGAPAGSVHIEGVEDQVGNTVESVSHVLALQPTNGSIIINEILFDPRADEFDGRPDQVEYVEVRNQTDSILTLNGLFLTDRPDEHGRADTVRAGRRVVLPANGYGVVTAAPNAPAGPSASQLASAFPNAPLSADSVAFLGVESARLGLDNAGDLVRVHRADGSALSDVSYRPDWHASGLEETKGTALERISPTGRPNAADNWTSSPDSAGGTPGTANAISLPPADESEPGLTIAPSPFSIERDGATRIQFTLDGVPNLVRARIYDARGRRVRTLEDARLTGSTGELVWNGRDDEGHRVRLGIYVVLLEAVRAEEGTVRRFKSPVVVARPLN